MAGDRSNRGSNRGGRGDGGNQGRGQRGFGGRRGPSRGGFRGRGRGGGIGYRNLEELDFVVQRWEVDEGNGPGRGGSFNNSRSGASTPKTGTNSPRGRGRGRGRGGYDSPSNRGRGRGEPKLRPDAPLSKLLFQERPLLRPIKFVKSVFTPTLFQHQDDVLEPVVESAGDEEASHVPTAERVARVFSGGFPRLDEASLEEIDFQELDRLSQLPEMQVEQADALTKETFTGVITTKTPSTADAMMVDQSTISAPLQQHPGSTHEPSPAFFIDTDPIPSQKTSIQYNRVAGGAAPLGDQDDDDEQIVYVAPHPRISHSQPRTVEATPSHADVQLPPHETVVSSSTSDEPRPALDAPSVSSLNFTFAPSPRKQPRHAPVFTAGARAKALVKQRVRLGKAKKRQQVYGGFGAYGAMMSEAQLRGEETIKDPKWEARRRGDSDIDWGDEDDEGEDEQKSDIERISGGVDGMDLDPDLELDVNALKSFVQSMSNQASNQVTMDDIADAEKMKEEDEMDEDSRGSSDDASSIDDEADAAVNAEEELLISETLAVDLANEEPQGNDEEDDDEESEDDEDGDGEVDPRSSFQARLQRIRSNAKGKARLLAAADPDDDSEEDEEELGWDRGDEDEDFLNRIDEILAENSHILKSGSRKQRKSFFRAIQDGDFDDLEEFNTPRRAKDRGKDLPPELAAQWERDRQKKAENKRARAQARLELAADPFSAKKGGKKGRKAMLAAAKVDPTTVPIANRITDMQTLETKIREFIRNIGGPRTMSLPPMRKDLRALVHQMALAFNLKSKSHGKGDARYITLIKTTRTGFGIDEAKVSKIVRRSGGRGFQNEGGNGSVQSSMKMREGEEVGKAAPKIGESNLGFKMLAAMGWAEGDRIGLSGGLDDPLTAIIKRSRLGLGATK